MNGSFRWAGLPTQVLKLQNHVIACPRRPISVTSRWIRTDTGPRDRVSGIWYMPKAADTNHQDVIPKLPRLLSSIRKQLKTAVFFATPSIAHWFTQDHEFLTLAMNQVYGPVIQNAAPTSIVAIIDALPSPSLVKAYEANRHTIYRGAEGLALCLLDEPAPHMMDSSGESELPLVNFRTLAMEGRDGWQHSASISLQIANTLFINGAKSTLFCNRWSCQQSAQGLRWRPSGSPENLTGLNIPVEKRPNVFCDFGNHLHVITQARQIVSSMGNVVRELQGDDGSTMKASAELEKLVPEFLKSNEARSGPGRVEVYALLMPPPVVEPEVTYMDERIAKSDSQANKKGDPTQTLLYKALWQGGRLHKVTGGGGGWGKKAGLLSLDTSTNFESSSQFEIAMFPSLEDDSGVAPARSVTSEQAIPSSWSMQFLATFIGPEQDPYNTSFDKATRDPSKWTAKTWTWTSERHNILVGITDPKEEHIVDEAGRNNRNNDVFAVSSAFGMLSPNGICVSLTSSISDDVNAVDLKDNQQKVHQFRVDAPQTTFRITWKGPKSERDLSEVDEVPAFESEDPTQTQALSSVVQGAIQQSRKLPFRKISYQPIPKFEIPKRFQRRTKKWKDQQQGEPLELPIPVRKHKVISSEEKNNPARAARQFYWRKVSLSQSR